MNAAEEFWGAVDDVRGRIDGWRSAMKSDPTWPEFVDACNARAFAAWMEQRVTAADAARAVVRAEPVVGPVSPWPIGTVFAFDPATNSRRSGVVLLRSGWV